MNRIYNFSAGPATLPPSVLEEAAAAVREYGDSGMSLLELSHRSKQYEPIHAEALSGVLSALGLPPDEYAVALLGGGASLQFAMLPMNFLSPGQTADYLIGGEWGVKAAEDARRFGTVHVAGEATDHLPDWNLSGSARYVHITTNNTIEGTQHHGALPGTDGAPLVADASSDIFGEDRDHSRFDLLYTGAQKNAGPAGVTMVVVRRSFLETANKNLPPMLSYAVQVAKDSLYNTPPVFPIFVLTRVLRWIEASGGVSAVAARNARKAALIYDALDAAPEFYTPCVTVKTDRSLMNITWRLADESREKDLLTEMQGAAMDGLKGHRNVGGFRASLYNAFPRGRLPGARRSAGRLRPPQRLAGFTRDRPSRCRRAGRPGRSSRERRDRPRPCCESGGELPAESRWLRPARRSDPCRGSASARFRGAGSTALPSSGGSEAASPRRAEASPPRATDTPLRIGGVARSEDLADETGIFGLKNRDAVTMDDDHRNLLSAY